MKLFNSLYLSIVILLVTGITSVEAKYVCKWGGCGSCTDGRYFYDNIPQCINVNSPNWCAEIVALQNSSGRDCDNNTCYFCGEPPVNCPSPGYPNAVGSCSGNTYLVPLYLRSGEQEWVRDEKEEKQNLGRPCPPGQCCDNV